MSLNYDNTEDMFLFNQGSDFSSYLQNNMNLVWQSYPENDSDDDLPPLIDADEIPMLEDDNDPAEDDNDSPEIFITLETNFNLESYTQVIREMNGEFLETLKN